MPGRFASAYHLDLSSYTTWPRLPGPQHMLAADVAAAVSRKAVGVGFPSFPCHGEDAAPAVCPSSRSGRAI